MGNRLGCHVSHESIEVLLRDLVAVWHFFPRDDVANIGQELLARHRLLLQPVPLLGVLGEPCAFVVVVLGKFDIRLPIFLLVMLFIISFQQIHRFHLSALLIHDCSFFCSRVIF